MERYLLEKVYVNKHSCVRNSFTVDVNKNGEEIPGFQEVLCDLQAGAKRTI